MYCTRCGANAEAAGVCPACGAPIIVPRAPAVALPPAAAPQPRTVRQVSKRTMLVLAAVAAAVAIAAVVVLLPPRPGEDGPVRAKTVEMGILDPDGRDLVADGNNLSQPDISGVRLVEWKPGALVVEIRFTPEGARKAKTLTSNNLGQLMAIKIDGRINALTTMAIQTVVAEAAHITFRDEDPAEELILLLGGAPFRASTVEKYEK